MDQQTPKDFTLIFLKNKKIIKIIKFILFIILLNCKNYPIAFGHSSGNLDIGV